MTERELLSVLSSNIKILRKRSKLTQAGLAEKLNISVNFLSDIETGRKWPSPVKLVKLADIFGIEVYELLKPKNILPDRDTNIIKKYTDELLDVIYLMQDEYISKMNQK